MTTALIALESLRKTAQGLAEEAQAEMLAPGLDELTRVSAQGRVVALQTFVNIIAQQQAEGFTEDPRVALDQRIADTHERVEELHRSLRLRQSIAHLRDAHDAVFGPVLHKYGEAGLIRLAQAEPSIAYISLNCRALAAIVVEWTPEQQGVTDEAIAAVDRALEPFKALGFDNRTSGGTLQ